MKSQISGKEMLVKKLWVSFLFHTLPLIQYTIFFLNSIRFSYLLFSSVCCTEEEMWFQLTETRNNNCQGFFFIPPQKPFRGKVFDTCCDHCSFSPGFLYRTWKFAKFFSISYFGFCFFFLFLDFTVMNSQHQARKGEQCKLIIY